MSGFRSLHLVEDFVTLGGQCGHDQVSFLVDSGASHNFVSLSLCKRLGLNVETCSPVKVRLADQKVLVATK